jgi:hypothetical protein
MARIIENNFLMNYEDSGMGAVDMSAPTESRNPSQSIIDALKQQILAQGTIGQWKGSVGSDVALKGMAKALADQGITNINQVGMITETGLNVQVRPDGRGGFVDLSGKPVDPSIVQKSEYAGEAGNWTYYTAPVGTQQTIGNKETGQPLRSAYGTPEKTDPNMFGGTGEGKGGTSYNVQFDQAGNPIFYANKVASQSAGTINFGLKLAAAIAGLNGLEGLMANTATTATQAPTSGLLGGGEISGSEILARDLATDIGTGTVGGMTEAQLAQTNMALGGVGGSAGAAELASALATGAPTVATTALTGGSGLITGANAGITAESVAAKLAADAGAGGLLSSVAPSLAAVAPEVAAIAPSAAPTVAGMGAGGGITAGSSGLGLNAGTAGLGTSGVGAGITAGSGLTGTGVLSGSALGTGLLGTTGSTALTGTGILSGSTLGTGLLGTGAGTAATVGGVGNTMANLGSGALNTGISLDAIPTPVGTVPNVGNLISGAAGTAGNLLQMQESREAAQKAQAMIEAETEAAKQAAQFRPVGMTTRFGTSQFQVDPKTGQLISAGYTLTPEAKAQQDRLVALQNQGLTQAEQAQAQFAPLQTGAQSLFNLGNQYLAQSPQDVAQNYLNQQLALLQPGREMELANLQNRLQQQGRSGLSVAQGGSYGATTPELQALYNARAMQEAQLAANAQQAGQQQVQFGAGLLGQGASAMGQYYGGQQAAYAPYTTASGQVQGLEALGQQPLTMGVGLGQQAAQAGANVGRLGLTGAQLSTNLATSADATRNLAAQGLIAAGNPNAMLGEAAAKYLKEIFGNPP